MSLVSSKWLGSGIVADFAGLVAPHLGYEPVGSRTGVLENTKDGYEMVKVSREPVAASLANACRYRETRSRPSPLTSLATSRTLET